MATSGSAKARERSLVDRAREFAHLVAQGRARAGVTQEQLAEQLGISASYLSRVERGERLPARRLAIRFVRALGLDFAEVARCILGAEAPASRARSIAPGRGAAAADSERDLLAVSQQILALLSDLPPAARRRVARIVSAATDE